MKKLLLQNNPGERQFPVRTHAKYYAQHHGRDLSNVIQGYLIIPLLFISGAFAWFIFPEMKHRQLAEPGVFSQSLMVFITAIFICLCCIVLSVRFIRNMWRRPKREQALYYKASGQDWLPEPKRQALRLDLVSAYQHGFWCETLEYYPLEWRVGNQRHKFSYLALQPAAVYRKQLDDDWSIISASEFEEMATRILERGWHSYDFTVNFLYNDPERKLMTRLVQLTGLSEEYIQGVFEDRPDGRPPKLIWAFDWWRLIIMTRHAFMAQYISEERAWEIILQAAAYVYEVFDSYEDFYNNYRLGNAYWSNSYETTRDRREAFEYYAATCGWPIRQLAWPEARGVVLPEQVRTAFAHELTQRQLE
jgi:hypothetical protein